MVNARCLGIIMLDAGQGDATLIVHPDNSLVLVDCGSKKNTNIVKTEIETALDAYLQRTGNALKALVLTHPDGDHYNLVDELIVQKGVTIGTLYYGGAAKDYAGLTSWITNYKTQQPQRIGAVHAFGQSSCLPDPVPALSCASANGEPAVDVRVLAANAGSSLIKQEANPNSVVLLVTYMDINIFLMGDSTVDTEGFILSWDKINQKLTTVLNGRHSVLKAGHHGSETSTGQAWLDKIQPKIVLISSDTKTFNGTSIPRKTVVDRVLAGPIYDFNGVHPNHYYVDYDSATQRHEQVDTSKGVFTTLHLLEFAQNNLDFTAYGTSWYYTVTAVENNNTWSRGDIFVTPAVGWNLIKQPY